MDDGSKSFNIADLLELQEDHQLLWMESANSQTKLLFTVYSVHTSFHLKAFGGSALTYWFDIILESYFKFSTLMFVSAMTSPIAFISERWSTTFFVKENMPTVLSEVFLFLRYTRDVKEVAADLIIKDFTHPITAFPLIPLESRAYLYVWKRF